MTTKRLICIVLGLLMVLFGGFFLHSCLVESKKEQTFFDIDALASFYECNQESFGILLANVKDNKELFCIDMWGDSIEIFSHQMDAVCKDDIINYDNILLYMKYLGVTRIDYFNQNPTQIVFYFSSDSTAWSLYIIYGQDVEIDKRDSFFKKQYIDLGDSWVAYGVFCGI